jgi:hypothetical protein
MKTQKFMGRGQLIDRLAAQVGNREVAIGILQKRGHLMADGKTLTPKGQERDRMTAEERAKDRTSRKLGVSPSRLTYDPKTNIARKR